MFILSKITFFFLNPLNWILALLIWRFFAKSSAVKKKLTIVAIVLIFFFGNEVIYTKSVLAWQPAQVTINNNTTYEAGILLGGLTSFDKHKNGFLNAAADRLIEITALYHTKKIKKIIISGGSIYANRPKEANFLYKKLLSLGVSREDLIVENKSRTTFENAVFTKKIVDSIKLTPPFVLVTSAIHCPRAEKVFSKAGLSVTMFPSDFRVFNKNFDFGDYIFPKINIIGDWASFIKEIVGIWGYKLLNRI